MTFIFHCAWQQFIKTAKYFSGLEIGELNCADLEEEHTKQAYKL